ncbi:MAG TPA: hypothetical protein ENJ21_02645 [Chromatiaceae bacterium]|nr:hypothetical protein [Chromatiaceae bacterium]
MQTVATYRLGSPERPNIRHDNGFLDKFAKRAPTVSDNLQYAWWVGKLETAEGVQKVPFLPHNDISDGLAAYRHFLEGSGKDRWFSYERYVDNDPSGAITLKNAVTDATHGAIQLFVNRLGRKVPNHFEMTGSALAANGGSTLFPYPQTENWQKAIGAHNFWISADIDVEGSSKRPEFVMRMTLHVEDRYNFNPGAHDIATGIPDAANGIFEITGLAKQYLNYSTLERTVSWTGLNPSAYERKVTDAPFFRDRQPADNRRIRNRA